MLLVGSAVDSDLCRLKFSARELVKGTMSQKVAILDAGAQYGKLIDRRVRELNVVW